MGDLARCDPAQVAFLHHIFGVGGAAQNLVCQREEQRTVPGEYLGRVQMVPLCPWSSHSQTPLGGRTVTAFGCEPRHMAEMSCAWWTMSCRW